jgi:stress response protein YsnF
VRDPTEWSNDTSRSGVEKPDDERKLQLFAEELSVTKEKVGTGRVRVSTRIHERV